MKLAQQLRAATEKAIKDGITRYAIAKGAGIQYKTLSDWLSNDRDMALSTASKLADFLELQLHSLDKPKRKDKVSAPAVPAIDWGTVEPKKKRRDEGRERRK